MSGSLFLRHSVCTRCHTITMRNNIFLLVKCCYVLTVPLTRHQRRNTTPTNLVSVDSWEIPTVYRTTGVSLAHLTARWRRTCELRVVTDTC